MFKSEIKKLFILIILLIFLFFLFELICLFFVPLSEGNHKPDLIIGKKLIPNINRNVGTVLEPQYLITNSYGYNDYEHNLTKNNGTFRIAFLGDSYLEGIGQSREKLVFKVVEQKLNDKNLSLNVESMSFGISGNGNAQELLQIKTEVINFNPDLIILLFQNGDASDNSYELSRYNYRPYYLLINDSLILKPMSVKDYNIDRIRRYIFKFSRGITYIYKTKIQINNYYSSQNYDFDENSRNFLEVKNDSKVDMAWVITEKILTEMDSYSKNNNISFMIFSTTNLVSIKSENELNYDKKGNLYDIFLVEKKLHNISINNDIYYYPLIYDFRDYYNLTGIELNKYKNDHWNYEGHNLAAEIISNKIIEEGLIK